MKFRPCIDIHNGRVKQIVGASLSDATERAEENFVSSHDAAYYAQFYRDLELSGGHVILLNTASSPQYAASRQAALSALAAWPGGLMAGGGITPENAAEFLDAGASHVIVTSYIFRDGQLDPARLDAMLRAVGRERLVLDLSCRCYAPSACGPTDAHAERPVLSDKTGGDLVPGRYYVVTDRWQRFTALEVNAGLLHELSAHCAEFLIHAADVEGMQAGADRALLALLASADCAPATYAGGIHTLEELQRFRAITSGRLDFTIGSALDLFGGPLKLDEVLRLCDTEDNA